MGKSFVYHSVASVSRITAYMRITSSPSVTSFPISKLCTLHHIHIAPAWYMVVLLIFWLLPFRSRHRHLHVFLYHVHRTPPCQSLANIQESLLVPNSVFYRAIVTSPAVYSRIISPWVERSGRLTNTCGPNYASVVGTLWPPKHSPWIFPANHLSTPSSTPKARFACFLYILYFKWQLINTR